jgi:hypothetical protein
MSSGWAIFFPTYATIPHMMAPVLPARLTPTHARRAQLGWRL